jgi:hypothetical protein
MTYKDKILNIEIYLYFSISIQKQSKSSQIQLYERLYLLFQFLVARISAKRACILFIYLCAQILL